VQDLLARIFVANPAERITLSQIKQHPWFLKNLPIELAVSLVVRGLRTSDCHCWQLHKASTQQDTNGRKSSVRTMLVTLVEFMQ
jgi:hypothetical protein